MKPTTYPGIDYSFGLPMDDKGTIPNIDPETKIRYGVINSNQIVQAWADSSEPFYPCEECEDYDKEEEECLAQFCECNASYFIDDDGYQATQDVDDCDVFIVKSKFFTFAQFCSPCAPGACHLSNPLDAPVLISWNCKCDCGLNIPVQSAVSDGYVCECGRRWETDNAARLVSWRYPDNMCYCFDSDFFDDEFEACPYPIWTVEKGIYECIHIPKDFTLYENHGL